MPDRQAEILSMRRLVADMYAAHGKRHDEAMVEAHLEAWGEFRCPPCYAEAIAAAKRGGKWPLSAVQALADARDRLDSSDHTKHIGAAGQLELDIGKAEAWWRGTAADVIARVLEVDPTSAKFLAAKMWGSRAVPPWESAVEEDLSEPYGVRYVWMGHFAVAGGIPIDAATMEAAFEIARAQVLEETA